MAIDARQKAMKRDGVPVISFGAGEPDFRTPEPIARAGAAAIAASGTISTIREAYLAIMWVLKSSR